MSSPCYFEEICHWCGEDGHSSLKRCHKEGCGRRFCKYCIKKIRKGVADRGIRTRTSFCPWCETGRLLEGKSEEESEEEKMFKAPDCAICKESKPEIILIPCRHACLCRPCFRTYKWAHKFTECPVCRAKIDDIRDV